MGKRKYQSEDDQIIRDLLPTMTHAQIADRLGWATELSVRKRVARLGLCRPHSTVWTPQKDADLIRQRKEHVPFSVIAQALDMTRNACIGRARRLGLVDDRPARLIDFRPKRGRVLNATQKINRARSDAKKGRPRFKPEPIPDLPISAYFRGVTLLDLEPGQCRYPQGDAPTILFCGEPVVPDTSWCKHCSKIVYSGKRVLHLTEEERFRRLRQGRKNHARQAVAA